ncbi:hypothetical protein KW807_02115 [Candidatus Parcubacteria bacterium]|nr:hypothetical protein [Candidatus Parcubacteria bacterium]
MYIVIIVCFALFPIVGLTSVLNGRRKWRRVTEEGGEANAEKVSRVRWRPKKVIDFQLQKVVVVFLTHAHCEWWEIGLEVDYNHESAEAFRRLMKTRVELIDLDFISQMKGSGHSNMS